MRRSPASTVLTAPPSFFLPLFLSPSETLESLNIVTKVERNTYSDRANHLYFLFLPSYYSE